jgi:hypothetical protein
MPKIETAIIYIDWGAAQRFAKYSFKNRSRMPAELIKESIDIIDKRISDFLERSRAGAGVRVKRRFYNGWHQGKSKTESREQFEEVEKHYIHFPVRTGKISFDSEFGWGDKLLCGGPRSMIWDTLGRKQESSSEKREKKQRMVDMCLGSDLLIACRHNMADFHIVICDDDDIWPAIVTSLEWGAKTKIMRVERKNENRHLNTRSVLL